MAIIKNPLTIVQTGGESQVPEYMSAKNFTFDGNACTGYVGDNSFPEIIIPKSYSKISSTETIIGAKVLDKTTLPRVVREFVLATFSDGENNTHIYLSPEELYMLENDFPNDCYLVSMEVSKVYNFEFLNQVYDMQILQFPININGQSFSDGNTAFDYIVQNNITNVNFAGDVEFISYIDGDDYQVTSIASNNDSSSGFTNYYNKVILLNNITSIGANAFNGCRNLSEISMPSTITNIGNSAFFNCQNLKMITIPPNVNSIGRSSFSYCSNLTSVIVPEGVASIGVNTFLGAGLMTIILPSTVTSIIAGAFEGCLYLQSIIVNNNNTTYHSKDNCIIETSSKELIVGCNTSIIPADDTVTSIANSAFSGCGISSINIPNNITLIGNSVFRDCSSLQTVDFGVNSQLQTIGQYSFYSCSLLESITIPANVTKLGDAVFQNCRSLTTVTIEGDSQLESIGRSAFSGCSSLTEITLPTSVTSISDYTFNNCSSLTTMTILATTPPTLGGTKAISSATTKIYIPAGTLSAYQSATNWSNFASLFEELPA